MRHVKRLLCYILMIAMVSGLLVPMNVEAKGTPKISRESLHMYVGQARTINMSGVTGKVKWTSTDSSVAKVSSNGKVTAQKAGKTTIEAKVGGTVYQCKVTVRDPRISSDSMTMYSGQSRRLRVLGVPGNVKWTSTDSSVAKVSSNGKVSAKKAGIVTIKAKANGKVYRCKVTVKRPALNKTKLTISIGQTAKIRLYGSKIQKVKSSNTKVARITKKGEVIGRSKGRATLTITGKNNKNYKCKVTVIDSNESSGDNKESSGDHKDTAGNDEDDSGDNKDVATGSEEPAGDNKDPVVSFVTYSNYAIPEKVYAKGSKLGELPSSSKLNYIFAGWYYDEALTSPVSVNDEVTKDLTLYAKYRESSELAYEENASSCVESDVSDSFTISIHSDEAIALKDANCSITIENITNPGSDEPMALSGSGENFKLAFTENGFDPGASYKVVLSDERLHFVGAPEAVREFDFTAHAEEVNHMQYTDTVIYLKASDVSDITINGKPAEDFSISLFSTGKDGEAEGKQEGTFSSQKKLKVGDTVVLYDGVRPDQRTIDTPSEKCGDVAYIEITKANGENYSFEQAEAENVIFTPDMLPINTDLDKDKTDGNVLTVNKDDLSFTDDVYAMIGLDSRTTVDVGDFCVFYEGEFDFENNSEILYGEITKITESGEDYVITYNDVDWDYVAGVMDVYATENVDVAEDLDQETIAQIEESVEAQAIESGFAQEAGAYLAELSLQTDTFTEISKDMDLSDYKAVTQAGAEVGPALISEMAAGNKVEVSKPTVNAEISENLKQYTGVKGLRLMLQISTTITIHASDAADVKIHISGNFEQEISLDVGLKAKAIWDVYGIFPYISEYRINASVDLYEYTGIGIQADITTAEADGDKQFDGQDLADQVKDLLENFESSGDEEQKVSISNELVEKYIAMLENESDWVELYKVNLFNKEQYVVPAIPIVAIAMEANFVIQVNANVSLGMDFYYKNAKRYNYTIDVFARQIQNEVIDLCEERYELDFFVMGALGIRAGVELSLKVGLFSTNLDSVGFNCEAGAYVKLYGYFWYRLQYTKSAGRKQSYLGALYVQIGAYLEVAFEAQALGGTFSKSITLYEKEWPLWDVGRRENVLDFKLGQEEMPEIKLKQYIKEAVLQDEIFAMNYLDLVEGEEDTKVYDDTFGAGFFAIEMTNHKFKYDPATNILKVVPDSNDVMLEGDMIITWIPGPLAFTSKPIRRTIPVKWDNLRDGYVIIPYTNGGSYVPIVVAKYGEAVTQPENPKKPGYIFAGWYADEAMTQLYEFPEKMSNVDTSIYAKWEEATDTPYKVNYYLQNLESGEYTLDKTLEGAGRTNSVVRPMPEIYEGFTTPEPQELTILADGSAQLNYYYDRLVNHVTFSPGEAGGENVVLELKYGGRVSAPVFAANGYTFKGWDKEVSPQMGADDITYTAQWEPAKTTYRVEYYVQNKEGKYRLQETIKDEAYPDTAFTSGQLRKDDVYENAQQQVSFSSVTVNGVNIDQTDGKKAIVSPDGKTVIKVNYARASGDVTFRLNNGEDDIVETYYLGQTVEFPAVTRQGYNFCGWYRDAECKEQADSPEFASPGNTYYAKWEEKPSVVVEHYLMKTDGTYAAEADRIQQFEAALGDEVNVSAYVASDIPVPNGIEVDKLSADILTVDSGRNIVQIYYKRIPYSLDWQLNGGTAKNEYSEAGVYYYGAPIIAPIPNRTGFVYNWVETPATAMPANDVSFEVTWEESDQTVIKFVTQDNTLIEEIRGYAGDQTVIPEPIEKSGYQFVGWNQDIPEFYPVENMTITALYEPVLYTIVYEQNGGKFAEDSTVKETYTVEDPKILLPLPVKKGYAFDGWYTDRECNTGNVTEIEAESTGNLTFYAKWTANSYRIEFDAGDADNKDETMPAMTMTYDRKACLLANIYTKEGYQFVGWTTVKGGTRAQYADEEEVQNLTDEMDASVTLYAVFGHSYHITYGNLSDAQMPQDAVDSFTADCAPITLSAPKKDRTGYTFAGWYLSQDFERNTKVDTITPETMRRNITVYAKWKANPYVIKFDANLKSGSAGATQLCTYDQGATLKAFSELGFSNPGYAFMGWTTEQSSGRVDYQDNQDIKNLVSQGSITLYAVWSEITYMITYIYGDGSQTSGNLGTYTINSADIQLEAPRDIVEGYQFLGWYDDEIDSYVTTIQHGTYGNRILVAKWAHGGIFEIAYDRTTGEGESIYRIIRHIPEHAQVTTDVQNVYYRTENGTAIGGTAKEVNFLHAGGPEQFVIFNQTDGDGSYKEIKVQKENSATAFTPNGSAQYPAASMVARVSETAPEKYYFVKVTEVLSTQGNCQGILGEQTRVRRVIPFDESRVVDISGLGKEYVHENTELLSADHKVTAGDHFSYSHKLNEILSVFATLRPVDREYIEDTIGYYDYYLTADVREAYDGYQEVEFSTGAGYLQYEFEIKPGSTCKDWQIATRMPAPGINQGQVKKFELTSSNSNGISQIQDTTGYKVRIDKSSDKFVVEFGAHGSLQDDWHIKNIKEYLQPVDKKNAKQVSIAPMAFGKYKKGEEITIAVVMNELIRDYTSQEDLTGALNTIGIPVGSSTLHDIEETKGTNVIYIDAVLKDDFEVTVDFNEKIISNTSLLGGTVTDLSGNTGSLQ